MCLTDTQRSLHPLGAFLVPVNHYVSVAVEDGVDVPAAFNIDVTEAGKNKVGIRAATQCILSRMSHAGDRCSPLRILHSPMEYKCTRNSGRILLCVS